MGSCLSHKNETHDLYYINNNNNFISSDSLEIDEIKFDIISSSPTELIHYYFSYLDPISLTKIRLSNSKFKKEGVLVLEYIYKSLKNKYFNNRFKIDNPFNKSLNKIIYEMCNYDYHEILISGGLIYENRDTSTETETMLKSSFKMKISKKDFTISFEEYKPLQLARRDHPTIQKDGIIYSLSTGLDEEESIGHVECLDILTEQQFEIKRLPINFIWISSIVFDNKIWVIGGLLFNSWIDKQSSNKIYMYDEENNNWIEHPTQLINGRSSASLYIFNDQIYICGGIIDLQTKISSIEIFDPKTGIIEEFGNTSKVGCNFYNFIYENNLYILNKNNPITIEKMDLISGNWELISELILEEDKCRDNLTAIFVEDKIFILGGYGEENTFDYYDFKTNTWTSKDELCINHSVDKRTIPYKIEFSSAILLSDGPRRTWSF